jgi:hypothetical protein
MSLRVAIFADKRHLSNAHPLLFSQRVATYMQLPLFLQSSLELATVASIGTLHVRQSWFTSGLPPKVQYRTHTASLRATQGFVALLSFKNRVSENIRFHYVTPTISRLY